MGPSVAFADRDGFKHPLKRLDLDSSGGATGYVAAVERHLVGNLKRSSFSLNVGTDKPYVCLKNLGALRVRPHYRMSRCPAGPLAGTPPSSGVVHCSSTTGTSGTSQPPSTTADWTSPSGNACFFISSGYRVATASGPGSTRQAPTRCRRSSCW